MNEEKLSIIIPLYNEEKTILRVLGCIRNLELPLEKEVIIVDDGSIDNSFDIVKKFSENKKEFILIKHKKNFGKGCAIRTGLKKATGDIIIIQDADLEYSSKEYVKLLAPILKKEFDVVYGSRFLEKTYFKKNKFYWANKFISSFTSLLFFKKITDVETCYKVFRREIFEKLNLCSKRFEIEAEITSKILKKKIPFLEIPIKYFPRTKKQGKKIGFKDGVEAIFTLLKHRLN